MNYINSAEKITSPICLKEIGEVREVKKSIVRIGGMENCLNGQAIKFSSGVKGIVMGFDEHRVLGLILGYEAKVRTGENVYSEFEPFCVPVGEEYLGRIIDIFGNSCDGKGDILADERQPIFKDAPETMDRGETDEPLETGIRIIDATIPMVKGQRQLIIGDRATGKTTIAIDSILHQKSKDIICIYCCIGKSFSALLKTLRVLQSHGALDNTIVIQAMASAPCGQQYLVPYAASTMGEYFMRKGRDVLLIFDDLTRHAWAYRELSLLMERPPGREAYPGDIYYIHSMLLERGGKLNKELGGGSISSFSIVETIQGDVTGFIPSNLVSMTDGQILLSTAFFTSGFKPAIDFGQSVSIIGTRAQPALLKELSRPLRVLFTKYNELLALTKIKTSLSAEAEITLKRGRVLSELFSQDKNSPSVIEEQIIFLYALSKGMLDNLGTESVKQFKYNVFTRIKNRRPEIIKGLSAKNTVLSEATKKMLDELLADFLKTLEPKTQKESQAQEQDQAQNQKTEV